MVRGGGEGGKRERLPIEGSERGTFMEKLLGKLVDRDFYYP